MIFRLPYGKKEAFCCGPGIIPHPSFENLRNYKAEDLFPVKTTV